MAVLVRRGHGELRRLDVVLLTAWSLNRWRKGGLGGKVVNGGWQTDGRVTLEYVPRQPHMFNGGRQTDGLSFEPGEGACTGVGRHTASMVERRERSRPLGADHFRRGRGFWVWTGCRMRGWQRSGHQQSLPDCHYILGINKLRAPLIPGNCIRCLSEDYYP